MKIAWYKNSNIWNLIIQSGQIGASTYQAYTLGTETKITDANVVLAIFQGLLGIVSLWTADRNKNGVIDIAEELTETTITVSSSGPVSVKDVTETKTPTE
jgi:hypothetical protein